MKKWIFALIALVPLFAWAQEVSLGDWLTQTFAAIKALGGTTWVAKVAAITAIITGSMKVTLLKELIWNKLKGFQILVAPTLAMIGGVVSLWASGATPTWSQISAYMLAGFGAVLLKDLLENLKQMPGIGDGVKKAIDSIVGLMNFLGIGKKA